MGRNRIVIERVSGHGCDRTAKPGEDLQRCASETCLECRVMDLIEKAKAAGGGEFTYDGCGATMTHWPNQVASNATMSAEVVDDMVLRKRRHGSF